MSKQRSRTESNLALIETFYDVVFEQHDFERLAEFVAPEFVQVESGEVTAEGVDALADYFEGMIETYEDPTMAVLETVADEDTVVSHFRMTGTLSDDLTVDGDVVETAGEPLEWEGFVSLEIADDRIVSATLLTDEAAILGQLGVLPEIAI